MQTEEERTRALAELERRETEYTRLRRQKLTVDDFEPLTIIGRGAFGEVRAPQRQRARRRLRLRKEWRVFSGETASPTTVRALARRGVLTLPAPRRVRYASCASAPRATCSR
jgi:hypothetical protein